MKRVIIFLALIGISFGSFAQGAPTSNPSELFSQMWKVNSTYFNTVTQANLGTQKDTGVNAGVLTLSTAKWIAGKVNNDSFINGQLNGAGKLTLTANLLKITGSPTVIVNYLSSSDGINWKAIAGVTPDTCVLGSSTYTVKKTFLKQDLYFAVQLTGSSSSTYLGQAQYYFIKREW